MVTDVKRVGRNVVCPCGSGRKYKKCCLAAVQARMTPPRPAGRDGQRLVFHQTPVEVAAAREEALVPPLRPQLAQPAATSSGGGETIEATGKHPFWVISGEDLDKRPVPQHSPAEVPNSALPGRWVEAIDLRAGDVLFTRDGRRVPVTHVSVRQVKTTVYNLQVEDLNNYAVGRSGVLVHNKNPFPRTGGAMSGGYRGTGLTQAEVDAITADFRAAGGVVDQSAGAQRYLQQRGAGGLTFNHETVLLPANPTRSAVFEELVHAEQFRRGVTIEAGRGGVLRFEAEAAETLLRNRHAWQLPPGEVRQIIENLRNIRAELQRLGVGR